MNVAPGINYPDPWWRPLARATPPASASGVQAGVPTVAPDGAVNKRNEVNSFGPGIGRQSRGSGGLLPGTPNTPTVQQFAFTLIQNQASG